MPRKCAPASGARQNGLVSGEGIDGRQAAIRLHEGQLHIAQARVKAALERRDVPGGITS